MIWAKILIKNTYVLLFLLATLNFYAQSVTKKNTDVDVIKRSFKNVLSEKYNGKAFEYEKNLLSVQPTLMQKFKIWLQELLRKLFGVTHPEKSIGIVLWVIRVVGILLFIWVIYKIVKILVGNEKIQLFSRPSESLNINAYTDNLSLLDTDFEPLIKEVIAEKKFRWAVRYYYLWVLKKLVSDKIIDWHTEKTNKDYLKEIKDIDLKQHFKNISYLYDYCWYGEFDISENEFIKSEISFKKILNTG